MHIHMLIINLIQIFIEQLYLLFTTKNHVSCGVYFCILWHFRRWFLHA